LTRRASAVLRKTQNQQEVTMNGNTKGSSAWGGAKAVVWGLCVLALVFSFALAGCSNAGGGGGGPTTPAEIQGNWIYINGVTYTAIIIGEKSVKSGTGTSQAGAIAAANASSSYDYKGAIGKYHKFETRYPYYAYVYRDGVNLKLGEASMNYSTEADIDGLSFTTFTIE
jgi:hypothetical protein